MGEMVDCVRASKLRRGRGTRQVSRARATLGRRVCLDNDVRKRAWQQWAATPDHADQRVSSSPAQPAWMKGRRAARSG